MIYPNPDNDQIDESSKADRATQTPGTPKQFVKANLSDTERRFDEMEMIERLNTLLPFVFQGPKRLYPLGRRSTWSKGTGYHDAEAKRARPIHGETAWDKAVSQDETIRATAPVEALFRVLLLRAITAEKDCRELVRRPINVNNSAKMLKEDILKRMFQEIETDDVLRPHKLELVGNLNPIYPENLSLIEQSILGSMRHPRPIWQHVHETDVIMRSAAYGYARHQICPETEFDDLNEEQIKSVARGAWDMMYKDNRRMSTVGIPGLNNKGGNKQDLGYFTSSDIMTPDRKLPHMEREIRDSILLDDAMPRLTRLHHFESPNDYTGGCAVNPYFSEKIWHAEMMRQWEIQRAEQRAQAEQKAEQKALAKQLSKTNQRVGHAEVCLRRAI